MGGGGGFCPNGHYDHDFPKVLNQIINVTLYNNIIIPLPALFLSILILNITDIIQLISWLNNPVPRMQNAERDNFLSCNKKFEKIDTNLAL